MARRTAMGPPADGPPPSTLAAQIVHNQTRSSAPQNNGEKATFAQLLREILNNPTATPETDVHVNVKLISVVAEAGLGPLTALENPFAPIDDLLQQATDSIAVIEATIRRQPDVLFTSTSHHGPQLLLSLLARLVAVTGRAKCEELPVQRLLDTIFAVLQVSLNLWQSASAFRGALQDCIDEALTSLESCTSSSSLPAIKLPSARIVADLWPESENQIALPPDCQAIVTDPAHAFMLVLTLASTQALPDHFKHITETRLQRLLTPLQQRLESTAQYDVAVQRLLASAVQYALLASFCESLTKGRLSQAVQAQMAVALIRALRQDTSTVEGTLLPTLLPLTEPEDFDLYHEDLRIAITTIVCRLTPKANWPPRVLMLAEAFRQDNIMSDSELLVEFKQLSIPVQHNGRARPTRKRRRIAVTESGSTAASSTWRVVALLTGTSSDDMTSLRDAGIEGYCSLSENDKSVVWQGLAELVKEQPITALEVVSTLLEQPEPPQSKQLRILSLLTVKACVERTVLPLYVDLGKAAFGQMCLRSLHSSVRELRMAAGQTLAVFLRNDLPANIKTANSKIALEYVRALSDRDVACEQDTLVGAWGHIASVCGDFELNLVLLRLVDYLGHTNPLICGLAFTEIQRVALMRSQTVEDLLQPFWGSVAVSVVQDLETRPQKAQQICDLLGLDLSQWLVQTQQEILPTLVMKKKKAVLEKIASARGEGTAVYDLCVVPKSNLAAILAHLLLKTGNDFEEIAWSCLTAVSSDFPSREYQNLTSLIRGNVSLIACELLKHIGEQWEARKSRAYQAFQVFAGITERRAGQMKANMKPARTVIDFFESHALGILTPLSEILESPPGVYLMQEKIRSIKAIGEIVHMSRRHVNVALPQIRAALQSAMENKALCGIAFKIWLDLVSALDSEDVPLVLEQTFALILRHWNTLSPDMQHQIHDRLGDLVKNHNQIVQDNIMTLPSLTSIPLLAKLGGEIERLKSHDRVEAHCKAFSKRLRNESSVVVLQALVELVVFLETNQEYVCTTATAEQPSAALLDLIRTLLDVAPKYANESNEAAELLGKALGIIGSLDPNRVETTRKKRQLLVLSNFDKAEETVDWVIVLLEDVLVKAFKSVSNAKAQGFLAFVLQGLLRFCKFNDADVLRPRASQAPSAHQKWTNMPEAVRITLTPFTKSRYVITSKKDAKAPDRAYPGFLPEQGHNQWLQGFVVDLLWKAKGENARLVFPLLARVVRGYDLAIASFLLPYAMLNVVLGGTVSETNDIASEVKAVLGHKPADLAEHDVVKLCSESVFVALDYMSSWLQEKKKQLADTRSAAYRTGISPPEYDEARDMGQIDTVEGFLSSIPAEVIASQAVLCGSYTRALFHWEQYVRQKRPLIPSLRSMQKGSEDDALYSRLHSIYAQIDEPDGLEGLSAHLQFLTEEQQALQHERSGRWTAAQAWYESELADRPGDSALENSLLRCLRETGQYAPLLRYADSFISARKTQEDLDAAKARFLPLTVEAQWMIGDISGLQVQIPAIQSAEVPEDFNVGVASILVHMSDADEEGRAEKVNSIRRQTTQAMTLASTSSVYACRGDMMKLHILHELDSFMGGKYVTGEAVAQLLDKRLAVLGSDVSGKQRLLGIRRVAMQCLPDRFEPKDLGPSWLLSAKLARQSRNTQQAYNAILRAYDCGEQTAKLEEARLQWRDGHQRHAIQALQSSIASGIFDPGVVDVSVSSNIKAKQDMLSARASLLLAKWLDALGQSQMHDMTDKYQYAAIHFQRWEKGHYYLGKHYQKLLEAEKALPKEKQTSRYRSGELTRLVIENLLRSVPFGNKYWHETIPKLLTLWLDLGADVTKNVRGSEEQAWAEQRTKSCTQATKQLRKYFDRVPSFVFYSAMPQMISRITHPNKDVWGQLHNILTRLVTSHPNQALWSLLAVIKSTDPQRVNRGMEIVNSMKDPKKHVPTHGMSNADLRVLIAQGQKLSDGLLQACETHVEQRVTAVSLSKDLGFNVKLAPNPLVVPIETTLTASLPSGAGAENIRKHRAFVQDKITIQAFEDRVLVLSSLQRPRKLTVRGSDGKQYGLLCKPKDDLRKDQRLMEFNGIINRALKRDAESSKRRLYIKTYAVTPLSEESGIIEWVEGIKPMRDILLGIYARKSIRPNYPEIRRFLDDASTDVQNTHIFTDKVLPTFPACLHEWFTEVYPEPDAWFAARLRYARSAAVMSIVGHVLGLGDRHGENILLEESTGGVFHVDFNCLFDKGLTFEKPEVVPFRLTHNMVDAMGPYGYEGPFRKSSELTLRMLRQSKDTLMTILETFLYDPTTDFVQKKKKGHGAGAGLAPEKPEEILESVDGKLKGLLKGETVPLGVEGYVEALVREAVNHWNLTRMYIGWCAFL